MGLGMIADQLADLKLGELLDTPPPGLDEAVAIAKVGSALHSHIPSASKAPARLDSESSPMTRCNRHRHHSPAPVYPQSARRLMRLTSTPAAQTMNLQMPL